MPKGRSKESHLLKASLTPLIYSHKHRAPWHSEETHSQWLERLLYFDESVGCISRNKEARLQNLHILFKIMSPKTQSHTASFFHANMHASSFKILRSLLCHSQDSLQTLTWVPIQRLPSPKAASSKPGTVEILQTQQWNTLPNVSIISVILIHSECIALGVCSTCVEWKLSESCLPHKSPIFTELRQLRWVEKRNPLFNMAPIQGFHC